MAVRRPFVAGGCSAGREPQPVACRRRTRVAVPAADSSPEADPAGGRAGRAAPQSLAAAPPEAEAAAEPSATAGASASVAAVAVVPVRGLVPVFMTVRRCSNCSVVAKISTWCRPWRRRRMKAPWSWRSSSSEGSAPSWSIASVQLRATRARKSASFSAAVRVRACSIRASGLRVTGVPDLLQRGGDDRRGPGRDLARGDRGAEFLHARQAPAARRVPGGAADARPGRAGAVPPPR